MNNRNYIKFLFQVAIGAATCALGSCEPKGQKIFVKENILGTWYLNEWTLYHTLTFIDSTVYIDNHVDTLYTMKYAVEKDTLRTAPLDDHRHFANRIIKLTKDTLVLDGLIDVKERRMYIRTKGPWKI